jgi:hypothetical protein
VTSLLLILFSWCTVLALRCSSQFTTGAKSFSTTFLQEEGEDGGEFASNVRSLEGLTLRALHSRAGGHSSSSVVFRPVFWRTSFRSRISCDEQIALCALPSLPRYRTFFSAAILDVFYYTSRALHASMLKECAHQLNHE